MNYNLFQPGKYLSHPNWYVINRISNENGFGELLKFFAAKRYKGLHINFLLIKKADVAIEKVNILWIKWLYVKIKLCCLN